MDAQMCIYHIEFGQKLNDQNLGIIVKEEPNKQGVLIKKVKKNTLGEDHFMSRDMILKINGDNITSSSMFQTTLNRMKQNKQNINFDFQRACQSADNEENHFASASPA